MAPGTHEPEVLLVSHSGDYFTVDRVAEELAQRGARVWRLDTDLFPTQVRLGIQLDQVGARPWLTMPDGVVCDLDRLVAVWIRKIFAPILPEDLDPSLAPGCRAESHSTLNGFWDALAHLRLLDPPAAMVAAEQKIRQLRLAVANGLTIPRTVVTNDPRAVRDLHAACDGRIVAKLLNALSTSMGTAPLFVHTSPVAEEDLDHLESLALSPMIFQERIDKDIELRVAYVAGRCFAGGIDARDTAGEVDWRLAGVDESPWQPITLPVAEQEKLGKLMRTLGLSYGAVDFIRTPAGKYVFLEVNPAGEWGMLEKKLGLPIAAAIAEELLQP